jgi:4-hydroxy-2-oxoglutarate aldolase
VTKVMSKLDLGGIFPPICTPFKKNEELDLENLRLNLKRYAAQPLRGIVVMGSNGEVAHLSADERNLLISETVKIVKSEAKALGKDLLVVAGVGDQTTLATIQRAKDAAARGADAALVVNPSFFPLSGQLLEDHFRAVADASPIPVILYNVPKTTNVDIPVDVVVRLSSHPNIIGLKDSGGNITNIGRIIYQTKSNNFQVLAGSASFLLPSLLMGAVGGVCALANIAGTECAQVVSLWKQGKLAAAIELQQKLLEPNVAVTSGYGVPGLKWSLDKIGWYGGPARRPLQALKESDSRDLQGILSKAGLLPRSSL